METENFEILGGIVDALTAETASRNSKRILRSRDAKVREVMGRSNFGLDARGLGDRENPQPYSETAQEIKMRKAAEKRSRRAGK